MSGCVDGCVVTSRYRVDAAGTNTGPRPIGNKGRQGPGN
jgi:hypothetical protein